jgi:hypothetical protein
MSHQLRESQPLTYIQEFEFELTLKSGESKEFEYKFDGKTIEAEVEYEFGDEKHEWTDERALQEVLGLMAAMGIRLEASASLLADRALAALGVRWDQVEEIELEIAFSNGKEIEYEYEAKDKDSLEGDDEDRERAPREVSEREEPSD